MADTTHDLGLPTPPHEMTEYQRDLFQVAYAGALRDQANQKEANDMAAEFVKRVAAPAKYQRLVVIGLPFAAATLLMGGIAIFLLCTANSFGGKVLGSGICAGLYLVMCTFLVLGMMELDRGFLSKAHSYRAHGATCRCQTCDPTFDKDCKNCKMSKLTIEEYREVAHQAQLKASRLQEVVTSQKARLSGAPQTKEVDLRDITPGRYTR